MLVINRGTPYTPPLMNTPTVDQLKRGLEIAEQIAVLEKEMRAVFPDQTISPIRMKALPRSTKKRQLSSEALANIRAAQKRRRAREKIGKAQRRIAKAPAKKKGGITAAGRAKLAAGMRARW